MAFYKLPTGEVTEVANPELNPQLVGNATQLKAGNLAAAQTEANQPNPPANTSITGADLTSNPTPNYQTPKTTPPESIGGLTVPTTPSIPPLEQKAEDLTTQIQNIQNNLLGKGTFERGLQKEAGIPEKNQAILDYQTRLDELKKKEAVIQTQYGGSLAANQGVLEPFVTGEKDARLRQNAIEALTISASIDAMHGLITSAQSKIDRAIQEKYGPDEERLKIAQANLDTLVKSGSLTREQERRAENQQLILKEKENDLAIERDKVLEAQKLAIQIAANNPNINSQTIDSMQKAKSAFDVLDIAQKAGLSVNPNLSKQTTDTVFNLAQLYPDAGILPNDTLQQAQTKAAGAPSFLNKQTMTRAVIDPNTGQITYYVSKGPGQPTAGGGAPTPSPVTPETIPPEIKPALENALGIQYLDQGKLTSGQLPKANKVASTLNIPVLSKGDADEVQKAIATYNSANALMQTIIKKSNTLITAEHAYQVPGQYIALNAGATFRTNSDAAVFKNTVKAFSSLLTRAAGEKGVLTNIDVQRIINALPNFSDTKDIAKGKASSLDELFKGQVQGAIKAYIGNSLPNSNQNQPITKPEDLRNKYKY